MSQVRLVVLGLLGMTALYLAYAHGTRVTELRWQVRWAEQQAALAELQAAAVAAYRSEEQRRQAAVNEVAQDARTRQITALGDAAGADAAGQRMREQAAELASRSYCGAADSGAAKRSASARRAAMVLSDLLGRADRRAGELAAAYDSARVAGLACERAYQALHK